MNDEEASSNSDDAEAPKLYQFVGLVFLWLIPCFVVWVSLSSLLAAPAVWISELILTSALPDIVHNFTLAGPQAMLATHFGEVDGEIVSAQVAGYRLAYPINTRILTYALPFYGALHFATQTTSGISGNDGSLAGFGKGLLFLYPLLVLGLVSISLKNLMLGLGPVFIDSGSIWAQVIGLMYQLSTLMVPPLAPIMIWAWQSRESSLMQRPLVKAKQ